MGRVSCCSKVGLHRGPWSATEDRLLTGYIEAHGEGQWRSLPNKAGLLRCGKSCRLRWMNYLRPGIKRGNFTADEDDLIFRLHSLLGNRWSLIAGRLPGRTDNEIKNYWNTHLSRRRRLKNTETTMHKDLPKKRDKIYIPKPIRVSSSIFGSVNDKGIINTEDLTCSSWFALTDGTDGGVQVQLFDEDDHHNLLISGCDNMLEKLFDEYMHLLQNDNHIQEDSLLNTNRHGI